MHPRLRDALVGLAGVASLTLCFLGYCGVGRVVEAVVDAVARRVEERPAKPPAVPPAEKPPAAVPEKPAEKPQPAAPEKPQPPSSYEPKRAAVHFRSGSAGCSGTFLAIGNPRKYFLLTAAHCISGLGVKCEIEFEGRKLTGKVVARQASVDIALVTVEYDGPPLPVARIASSPPAVGDRLWHKGYGVDKPGNVEHGKVVTVGDADDPCWYTTRLSSGDSGSGQFREDTGELVALGCWGSAGRCGGPSWAQITSFLNWYFRGVKPSPPS